MPIQSIHTFLVHPRKGAEGPSSSNGASVPLTGRLFDLLAGIYAKSETECEIDITFSPTSDGVQQNDCRDLVCRYLEHSTLARAKAIAKRLELHTDARSGLGLLFLISGREGRDYKVVISRFPTDNAIYVDENPDSLTVEFLERVFMKNKASYKAVVYRHSSIRGGFWSGRAIDRQLNSPAGVSSNYWILSFLGSRLTTTPEAGTRRLAVALRDAAKKADLSIKQEIIAAATLAGSLAGRLLTISQFGERFGLSQTAKDAIARELKSPRLAEEQFAFHLEEFRSLIAFKSVELDNGGVLVAPSSEFTTVFHQEFVDRHRNKVRFSTEGKIVNERLKSTAR